MERVRIKQIGDVFAVQERVPCPCPDCHNPEHGSWGHRGGSMTRIGAERIRDEILSRPPRLPRQPHLPDPPRPDTARRFA